MITTMKKLMIVITIILISGFTPNGNKAFGPLPPGEWKLAKDKNDIKVYTRRTSATKIKEFKAVTTVAAPVARLMAVLNNVNEYPRWMSNINTSKTLTQINADTRYDYYEMKLPFPFDNRDAIFYVTIERDPQTNVVHITNTGKPSYIPEKTGTVRMHLANGTWRLTPKSNGKTEVVYQFLGDPAGNLPAWLINMLIVEGPFKTLTNLKEFVKKDKYQKIK